MTNECTHGQLARSCEICEKDARIAELEKALRMFTDACEKSPPVELINHISAACEHAKSVL